ncbi:hypothetical protein [Sphingomonas nostoxanthinifaciens]|uniref:hypothetical protein n=1 Tax=Sphingomonas nostoxanthinifaciens TaxID=2872652 RepID=UPI001CC1DAC8|nr:hypothetical protein [Sphingomonas nostoxanthinifaciens]UAK22928.1 hypothetical protein K8P63_10820 [Sphingomonas nostoxanthinifaciens]
MKRAGLRATVGMAVGVALASTAVAPADAYLFWSPPAMVGTPASGDDPTVVIPLAGATSKEAQANLLWTLRAGLNVAALQCQFAPQLRTVELYNNMLRQHAVELNGAYKTLQAYFKRVSPKTAATAFDQYTTRTYNGFSTLKAQMSFCDISASIGRDTMVHPRGELGGVAVARMRELRNSLVPVGDAAFAFAGSGNLPVADPTDLDPVCFDKKGRVKPCKK